MKTLGPYNQQNRRNLSSPWLMSIQTLTSRGVQGPSATLLSSRDSPLVQELLPDRPGEKADQRVLLQRVIQKFIQVVHLQGDLGFNSLSRPVNC